MPIYEYRCDKCGHEFETIQKISEAPLRTCPHCAEETLRKKVSAAGFRLKGGGWYETDFKSGGKKNVAGGEASSGGDDSGSKQEKSSASTGSESKSSDTGSGGTSKSAASE